MEDREPYSGVGSRRTPERYVGIMRRAGMVLAQAGYVLRSGAAERADEAFEQGAVRAAGATEIYLPSRGFRKHRSGIDARSLPSFPAAMALARRHHPAWDALSEFGTWLMARNAMQVLGRDLDRPSRFLLCWAPRPRFRADGLVSNVEGGTGLAVRLANAYNVPCFHLGVQEHLQEIARFKNEGMQRQQSMGNR